VVDGPAFEAPLPQPRVDALEAVVATAGAENVLFAMSKDAASFSVRSLTRVGTVYVALLAYFLILEYLGFLGSTFLLVSYLSIVIGRQRMTLALLRAAIVTGLSYALFDVVLKGQLPKGLLGP
jgi:hypothetical protein